MRRRYRYAAAALIVPFGLALPPTASADCTNANGTTVCAQGSVRGPDGGTGAGYTGPYVPYPCEYDWLCDDGLSIAIDPPDRPDRPWRPGGGGGGIGPR
ncbi:hypothetical protein C1S82_22270 [Mycolicibacterium cosmeticum]|uniref:Secreted protein n=1 Tax=Mycolicibacterium cosmeticum TaxID=258533 RepID=W9B911_MYCCO|nr:hypothetical protein [Mycolicibacterium cosmeticum]TLH70683.1 hypothetical protein C1S82_22270 [Mycolicibacterium cosmeticum]CDO11427.1 hypothetical protein BN977_06269 [Mycolicibacterium cosmeticum]